MCSRINCNARPEFRPVLVIPIPGFEGKRPLRAVMGVGLCMACKYRTKLNDVLSDAGWEHVSGMILQQLPEAKELDRSWVKLDFIGIRSKESLAYEALRRSSN